MMYADDTQLWIILEPSDIHSSLIRIEDCIRDIQAWNISNKLITNIKKTEVIHFTSKYTKAVVDYCNSLLYGLPDSELTKLQKVQNVAARLITKTPFQEHITPILKNLHWLPVKY
jgi:hypothetical protein